MNRAMHPQPRRVLRVTGGIGFVCWHSCERLLAGGDEVLAVDDRYTDTRG